MGVHDMWKGPFMTLWKYELITDRHKCKSRLLDKFYWKTLLLNLKEICLGAQARLLGHIQSVGQTDIISTEGVFIAL